MWWRRKVRADDARVAAELREQAAAGLSEEREQSAEYARRADHLRRQGRQNGFSEAMEHLYTRHLGASP